MVIALIALFIKGQIVIEYQIHMQKGNINHIFVIVREYMIIQIANIFVGNIGRKRKRSIAFGYQKTMTLFVICMPMRDIIP